MELYAWQKEAIDALASGSGRVLVIAPTGGGKSLCYQHPAAALEGTALVITPLVSLMVDQVSSLTARGVPATYLASSLTAEENRRREDEALRGAFKLLYVSPERLASARFVDEVIGRLDVSLLAVDEAHCISQWGHDFRPEYMQIGALVERLKPRRLIACTATATPAVRAEILERLRMPEAHQILRGFARENLEFTVEEVSGPRAKEARVADEVARVLGTPRTGRGSAIVYTSQRAHAESMAETLRSRGWSAEHYHAGMEGGERSRVQDLFQQGALDAVAATNAFGMGIDRPDIRLVAHHGMPDSVEAYYQEVGRAGRDGAPARGLLLISDPDIAWRFKLIAADPAIDAEQQARRRALLRALIAYAESSDCRHDGILRYFGDEAEALGGCGRCDNCRRQADGAAPAEASAEDSAATVAGALKAIRGLPFAVGPGALAAYLAGAPTTQMRKYDWLSRDAFGIAREHGEHALKRLLRRLVAGGLLAVEGERGTLHITRRGAEVSDGRRDSDVRMPLSGVRGRRSASASPAASAERSGAAPAIFEALRSWRRERSEGLGVPAYTVFADKALWGIADAAPRTEADLLAVSGVGPAKLATFGDEVLALVRAHTA